MLFCHFIASPMLTSFMSTAPIFSVGTSNVGLTAPTSSTPITTPIALPGSGASPSLATLLATPLSSLGSARSMLLVLSSALPPIPGKVVDTIRNGAYVDFKDLLPQQCCSQAAYYRHRDSGILSLWSPT